MEKGTINRRKKYCSVKICKNFKGTFDKIPMFRYLQICLFIQFEY